MTTRPPTTNSSTPAVLLVSVAIAVAGALLALRLHFQPPTVPAYTLGASEPPLHAPPSPARDATGSAADREVPVARAGRFSIAAHPEGAVVGAIAARGFLVRDGHVRPWDPPFEVTRDGSVRIAGPADTLFAGVPDGPWEIALAVGRPETLPTAPNDILRVRGDAGLAAWRLLRERIRLGS